MQSIPRRGPPGQAQPPAASNRSLRMASVPTVLAHRIARTLREPASPLDRCEWVVGKFLVSPARRMPDIADVCFRRLNAKLEEQPEPGDFLAQGGLAALDAVSQH